MMLKCKALPVLTVLLWLFAIGHCVAEGMHTHANPQAHKTAPHHHHHGHEQSHQHELPQLPHPHGDDDGVPCEMLSMLPADALLKLSRLLALEDHTQLTASIDVILNNVMFVAPLVQAGLPPPNYCSSELIHRLMTLTVSHGPPSFAC
jgi:hypothetical protein